MTPTSPSNDHLESDLHAARTHAASEFALLPETAEEFGIAWVDPAVERVDDGEISAVRWGTGDVDVVLLHGAGQNAHTWDAVLLALSARGEVTAMAIDLPGHGRSPWRDDHDYGPERNATAVGGFLTRAGVDPRVVVGMSLGGLTAIALGRAGTRQVGRVLVDVTPSSAERAASMSRESRDATILMEGPRDFASLGEMVDATHAASPTRSRAAIRRGVLHNAAPGDDGRWRWRYDVPARFDPTSLWGSVITPGVHTTVVRGSRSAFVDEEDVARLRAADPTVDVIEVEDAGHSVQGDQPIALAGILHAVIDRISHPS
ncbi:alpha/beta hydrolase [uncultured Williamsia sp.]|uniref:alpha/beta fold hydrolase n=1 Tax=uncultured Williamsia sp. TaxID=259311 RepID=UPI002605D16C|nr:alpha/beta hydrolase [uncultured Williamsia sp.]